MGLNDKSFMILCITSDILSDYVYFYSVRIQKIVKRLNNAINVRESLSVIGFHNKLF